ncbi:MAG: hypothetical protein O3A84_09705 [Proteobacteria bacterium]|nr:hypothetical protein [Pseudomonadota bacterium]
MPEITDRPTQITELANQAAGHLKSLMEAADEADKVAAFESYRDVLRLIGAYHVASYEGRTALLTGLIAELNEVTESITVTNPVAGQLEQLAGIALRARGLFKEEKTALPTPS